MMLDWLHDRRQDAEIRTAARAIEASVATTPAEPRHHTADLGGRAATAPVGEAIAAYLRTGA